MIGLLEAFNELDKLYEARKFNQAELAVSEDSIFKFFASTVDINSALKSHLVWSNVRTDGMQYDEFCNELENNTGKQWGFISLTAEPVKVALELHRPFGLEFDLEKIKAFVKDNGYYYKAYNQLKQGKWTRLNCVGKRKDGTYFFAPQGDWAPRDIDEKTYLKLVDWMKKNSADQLIHFDFTKVPADKICVKADGNIGGYTYRVEDYIDYKESTIATEDHISGKGNKFKSSSNKNFNLGLADGMGFTIEVQNYVELWATCLNKQVGLNSPLTDVYRKHLYNNNVQVLASPESNKDFALDEDTYKVLAEKLDEYEFRIYLPKDTIFKYRQDWVKSVRLPGIYGIPYTNRSDKYIRLEEIFNHFENINTLSEKEMIDICDNKFLVKHEVETTAIIDLYKLIKQNNILTLFYSYEENITFPKQATYKTIDYGPKETEIGVAGKDHLRYFADKSILSNVFGLKIGNKEDADNDEYRVIRLRDKEGNPSLVYKDLDLGNGPQPARLEVRGILLKQGDDGEWYINIVEKVDQGSWYELPGGSFEDLPSSESGLYSVAANKLSKETGLDIKANNLTMLDQLTFMYEPTNAYIKKLTAGTDLIYPITIDWTFVAVIDEPVDITKKHLGKKEHSYWLLVDWALKNKLFMDRYKNLKSIILDAIK